MKLREVGMKKEELFQKMESYQAKDAKWRNGKTWAYVYYPGEDVEEVIKKAYMMFLSENALDPTTFPSLLQFENDIVGIASAHLQGDEEVVGNFTSGGTESILLSIKAARDYARVHFPEIQKPELVIPETGHPAFHKGAQYFGLTIRSVPVDPVTFRALPEKMEAAITPNTILMVGSAVSYVHGVIDPIQELSEIALKRNLLFHVDGCVGGWILPFYRKLGKDIPPFDFSLPGVTSISMDLHKYGFCAKGASLIMYKNKELRKHQIFCCTNWSGYSLVNHTIQSSKTGGPLAAAWATLNFLGESKYLELAQKMIDGTEKMVKGINSIHGLRVLGDPDMNMLSFTSDEINIFELMEELQKVGWYAQPQFGFSSSKENLHISVNPASYDLVDDFLLAMENIVRELIQKKKEEHPLLSQLEGLVAAFEAGELDDESLSMLMSSVGGDGVDISNDVASINTLLNALPSDFKSKLLLLFFNKIYTPS